MNTSRRRLLRKEVTHLFWYQRQRGLEFVGLHIVKDGGMHLTGHVATAEITGNVHRRHQKTPLPYSRLNDHAEFPRDVPRVNGLNGRLVVGGQFHKVHDLGTVEQFPPVKVRPRVGWKAVLEERVSRVDIGSGGMRRAHLEPRRIPEDGQVMLLDVTAQRHLPGSLQQHRLSLPEQGECLFVVLGLYDSRLLTRSS